MHDGTHKVVTQSLPLAFSSSLLPHVSASSTSGRIRDGGGQPTTIPWVRDGPASASALTPAGSSPDADAPVPNLSLFRRAH